MSDGRIKLYFLMAIINMILILFNPLYGFLASIFLVLLTKKFEVFSKRWILFSIYMILFYYFLMGQNGFETAYRLLGYIFTAQWFIKSFLISEIVEFISKYNKDLGIGAWITFSTLECAKEEFEKTKNAQLSRGLTHNGIIEKYRAYYALISPIIIKLYRSAIKRSINLSSKCYE